MLIKILLTWKRRDREIVHPLVIFPYVATGGAWAGQARPAAWDFIWVSCMDDRNPNTSVVTWCLSGYISRKLEQKPESETGRSGLGHKIASSILAGTLNTHPIHHNIKCLSFGLFLYCFFSLYKMCSREIVYSGSYCFIVEKLLFDWIFPLIWVLDSHIITVVENSVSLVDSICIPCF